MGLRVAVVGSSHSKRRCCAALVAAYCTYEPKHRSVPDCYTGVIMANVYGASEVVGEEHGVPVYNSGMSFARFGVD